MLIQALSNMIKIPTNHLYNQELFEAPLTELQPSLPQRPEDPSVMGFLERMRPDVAEQIKQGLQRVGFDFRNLTLNFDNGLPMHVGGFYSLNPIAGQKYIGINSWLLMTAPWEKILYVIVHEGLHANAIRLAGIQEMLGHTADESQTDLFAQKIMYEQFGYHVTSGYQKEVELLDQETKFLSTSELVQLFAAGSNTALMHKLVRQFVLKDLVFTVPAKLSEQDIQAKLVEKWQTLTRLFPRLLNTEFNPSADVHAEAQIDVRNYDLGNLLNGAVDLIRRNPELISSLIQTILSQEVDSMAEFTLRLGQAGYGYLLKYFHPAELIQMSQGAGLQEVKEA